MSVGSAVLANLLSGVSCIIGAVVASYVEMSEEAVGGLYLLAEKSGVSTCRVPYSLSHP